MQPMVKAIPLQEDYTPEKLAGKIEGLLKASEASEVRPVKVAAWMPSAATDPLKARIIRAFSPVKYVCTWLFEEDNGARTFEERSAATSARPGVTVLCHADVAISA